MKYVVKICTVDDGAVINNKRKLYENHFPRYIPICHVIPQVFRLSFFCTLSLRELPLLI